MEENKFAKDFLLKNGIENIIVKTNEGLKPLDEILSDYAMEWHDEFEQGVYGQQY